MRKNDEALIFLDGVFEQVGPIFSIFAFLKGFYVLTSSNCYKGSKKKKKKEEEKEKGYLGQKNWS